MAIRRVDMPVINQLDVLILLVSVLRTVYKLSSIILTAVAFSRSGTEENPGCVVVLSNGDDGEKPSCSATITLLTRPSRDFLGKPQ